MEHVDSCIGCRGLVLDSRRAVVSSFLADRIWGRGPFSVSLVRCSGCGLSFFNPRLEDQEEIRLYTDYRGSEYLKLRTFHEPWYTPKLNSDLINDKAGVYLKRATLLTSLTAAYGQRKIRSILDYGGDKGQALLPFDVPRKFVYDISGTHTLNGITSLSTLEESRQYEFDLIMCNQVLEHVGVPLSIVNRIKMVATKGSLVYIEVPKESPFSAYSIVKRLVQLTLLIVYRPRHAAALVRPGFPYWMTEHITFFNKSALSRMAETAGMSVLKMGTTEYGAIWCLARV